MKNFIRIFTFVFVFSQSSLANIVGTDLYNFNPTSNGLDFVTVQSSDTLESGQVNVGAFLTYSTNSLPFFRLSGAPTNQKFSEPNDRILANDFHLGLGIIKGWDIGFSLANIINQEIDDSSFLGTFAETGVADVRFNTKIRLYKGESSGFAVNLSADKERVDNNPYSGRDSGLSYNLELAFDTLLSEAWRWGINAGYRMRDSGTPIANTGITPMSDQITYSSALSYAMPSMSSHLIFEIFGSSPTETFDTPTDRELSNLQGLAGWRWRAHEKFDIHFGGGAELYHGLGSPDIILYAGFNWRPGHLWGGSKDSDNDGVSDDEDRCPATPPAFRDQVNEYGCADSDQDGVYNDIDQCPQTPEAERSYVDANGCTNNDLDGDGVANAIDRCPNTPQGTEVNDLGCRKERVTEIKLNKVNFYSGTARLIKKSQRQLDESLQTLETIKDKIDVIIVEGHTDSIGSSEMNKGLSQKRANAIRNIIITRLGLADSKVEAIGYGEERPIDSNKTKSGRLNNRRVELRVVKSK